MKAFKLKIKDREKLDFEEFEIEEDEQPMFRAFVVAKITIVCDDEKTAERFMSMKKEDRNELIVNVAGSDIAPDDLTVQQVYRLQGRLKE